METGLQTKTTYPSIHRTTKWFKNLAYYTTLAAFLILLAGHENTNPRLGDSYIDFYLSETRHLIEINAKAYLLNPDFHDASFNHKVKELTDEFYRIRNYNPAWTINFTKTDHLDHLIRIADSAVFFGFPNSVINSVAISTLKAEMEKGAFNESSIGKRVDLEIEATRLAIQLSIYLNKGFVQEDTTESFNSFARSIPGIINNAVEAGNLVNQIFSLQPDIDIYKNIVSALPLLIATQEAIDTASLGLSKQNLANAFFFAGLLKNNSFDSVNTFNKILTLFQRDNNLAPTGKLTHPTVEQLKLQLNNRYILAAMNLDRIRKIGVDSENYLFVNIPEYKLRVYNKNIEKKAFNVVVGTRKTPTPVLSSKLQKIVTNPLWTVPRSITNIEMLAKIRRDSTYLARNGYFLINGIEQEIDLAEIDWNDENPLGEKYWLRQKNGSGNALGKIKFIFPNDRRVYLHDTPSKRFFKHEHRAYSHGCVRVQDPEELAQYLSDNFYSVSSNDSINILAEIKSRKRKEITIQSEVEVHLQYITCSTDQNGRLIFFRDVYRKDKRSLENFLKVIAS